MRNVVVTEYVTLDGVMENPGEWSFQFWNDEAASFKYAELFASDALLLGRVTYEGFASAWPTMTGTGDFGERMNGIAKYVVSSTLDEVGWNNSHLVTGDIATQIAALKQEPGQDILVAGSADLVQLLMQHGLVDEYRIMLHPIVLGRGKRLFREGSDTRTLQLVETKTTSTGVTILTYKPTATEATE